MIEAHLSRKELAIRLGVSTKTLQAWAANGKGPRFLKLGARVAYRLIDVRAWEAEHMRGGK